MKSSSSSDLPVAFVAGAWREAPGRPLLERRNPAQWSETLARVPQGSRGDVEAATAAALEAQSQWARAPLESRRGPLRRAVAGLNSRARDLTGLMAREIGKPVRDGEAEVRSAAALLEHAAGLDPECALDAQGAVRSHHVPHGVVGIITPWNNPVAIPLGKLAPALALGNTVVWKPAWQAPRTAMAVLEILHDAGLPSGVLNVVFGEKDTARELASDDRVRAVSVTGSTRTGRELIGLCSRRGKPVQAEMGGNNAAVVLRDFPMAEHAAAVARSAFSFCGQRCTSIQRFVVEAPVYDIFVEELARAARALVPGDPVSMDTQLGPMVSPEARERVHHRVAAAVDGGAEVLCGGQVPDDSPGAWYPATLVHGVAPGDPLLGEEIFGPVAVVQRARDLDQALELANGTDYGLVAALLGGTPAQREHFCRHAQAGILHFAPGPLPVDPRAPFGGWKASGFGPPEHGSGDLWFYARPQARYGRAPEEP